MVGALNKLPIALSGLVFFGTPVTVFAISAIILGFLAGLVYTVARIQQANQSKQVLPTNTRTMSASAQSELDAVKQ